MTVQPSMLDVSDLSADEVAVFVWLLSRVRAARAQYGELNLAKDQRNFVREAGAEAVDFAFYFAAQALRSGTRG